MLESGFYVCRSAFLDWNGSEGFFSVIVDGIEYTGNIEWFPFAGYQINGFIHFFGKDCKNFRQVGVFANYDENKCLFLEVHTYNKPEKRLSFVMRPANQLITQALCAGFVQFCGKISVFLRKFKTF